MVDPIYSLFSTEDLILFLSLFINFSLLIDYLDKRHAIKMELKNQEKIRKEQKKIARIKKIREQSHIIDWKI